MAITKNVLRKVATRKNLEEAWLDISRFARPLSHGMSEQTIEEFRSNYTANLEIIRTKLLSGEYQFGQLRAATIKKKSGKKRPLKIADIRDRVVQRAMARVLEKYLEKSFGLNNSASHAYLRKKGVQSAIKQMLKHHQVGCGVILETDIIDFFGTVKVDRLLNEMIFPSLPDKTLNDLIKAAFEMEIGNKANLPEEDWELFPESAVGLPQGGYLSPLFSNVYLSMFDHVMIEAHFRLIRYADDFIVLCKSIDEAEDAYKVTRDILETRLGLELHERNDTSKKAKTRIVWITQTPIEFLGIKFDGRRIWPDPEKRRLFSNKLSSLHKKSRTVRELLTSTAHLLEGWIAAYGFADLREIDVMALDDEVNKVLWRNLKSFEWKLTPKHLNAKQRLNSGVEPAKWYLDRIRRNLSGRDKDLLSKYWT